MSPSPMLWPVLRRSPLARGTSWRNEASHVLFCDIVGSTPLTERLGPEAMRDLVSSFLETSLAEVHRYGGMAPQFTGDGFMALFGAPLTQEDHVRRALLAAVAIQRARRQRRRCRTDWTCPCGSASILDPWSLARLVEIDDGSHGDRRHGQCRRPTSEGG